MPEALVVHKGRDNVVTVNLGADITGKTVTSEIRILPSRSSLLLATWQVAVVAPLEGELTLTLPMAELESVVPDVGYMDIKVAEAGGVAYPTFERPLRVEIRETVTV